MELSGQGRVSFPVSKMGAWSISIRLYHFMVWPYFFAKIRFLSSFWWSEQEKNDYPNLFSLYLGRVVKRDRSWWYVLISECGVKIVFMGLRKGKFV